MMPEPSNKTFDLIVQAALANERCPTNGQLGSCGSARLSQMAHRGDVLIEVFNKNFRKVTIMVGEHAGKHTANPPPDQCGRKPKPYLIISIDGVIRNGTRRSCDDWDSKAFRNGKAQAGAATGAFREPNCHPSIRQKLTGGRA